MAGGEQPEKPVSLFYSYSHKDEELRQRLEDHLAALRRSGLIAEWHDRNIDVGEEWAKEIDDNLSTADIILPRRYHDPVRPASPEGQYQHRRHGTRQQ